MIIQIIITIKQAHLITSIFFRSENSNHNQFDRQSATSTLSERHDPRLTLSPTFFLFFILSFSSSTFLFSFFSYTVVLIQTLVLYITVVAVPIILVISCPPFSLALLQIYSLDAQDSKKLTVGFSLTTIMENSIEISSIPILNNTNYGEWSARIVILLRSKDLLHVCENTLPTDATVPVTNKWNKANSEAISIISSRKLEEQYASKKAINRGRVWMQWLRSTYDGDLQSYIDNSRMLMMSLDTVNINIPAECHSFTLLGKLSGDPKIHQFVKVLSLNEELIQQPELVLERLQEFHDNSKIQTSNHTSTPTALVSESAHPYKITYYCTNGKHNPMCTTHTKETCFAENPHLRPTHRNNKRKTRSYQNPSAHLSTAQVLITGERSKENPEELIIDCGATHHMFNSRHLFSSLVETPPMGLDEILQWGLHHNSVKLMPQTFNCQSSRDRRKDS
ncbi:hypothetical protein O181_000920 [Austropuccinia psidii MF-1]|uniref:Retrotransposon Copia-like N-terminal domain-containing protein n=1 Tax=Austropuccinia psidii MF-1 TaxID=1389203 RepID=A0A9Q3B9Y8_9BASI|nr:hypothetical protein [Austropuccinia psidii MF-1]